MSIASEITRLKNLRNTIRTNLVNLGISSSSSTISDLASDLSTITVQEAAYITPTAINQTISAGTYLRGNTTIYGDANLVAANIKNGVTIFGVTGTYVAAFKFKYSGSCTLNGTACTSDTEYSATGNWQINFLTSGTFTVVSTGESSEVDVHCVGGGGGGACSGGGGGYTSTSSSVEIQAGVQAVVVGSGGSGITYGTAPSGSASSLLGCSASGGSGGQTANGGAGGSGGGAWDMNGTVGGSNGGSGGNATERSNKGGTGQGTTTYDFCDSSSTLRSGGGGGGCSDARRTTRSGGAGGGGNGGISNTAGSTNYGGGGGGGMDNCTGRAGGSGIVCLRNHR